ncbi:MAG: hypothetical protein Tsb0020_24620 [Haliangiales bacterium]
MTDTSGCTVVFGGTGNVGWGVATALLASGARVVTPTRSAERGQALAASLGGAPNHHIAVGDPSTLDGANALARSIERAHGPIQHVVASMGPWWQGGAVVEQPESEYRQVMSASLDCHVFTAQAFLPLLRARAGSTYTVITGAGANMEIPGTGLLVIAVSGVLALSRMLRAEHQPDAVRVNEVMIMTRVEREPRPGVVPAADFGQAVRRLHSATTSGAQLEFASLDSFTT